MNRASFNKLNLYFMISPPSSNPKSTGHLNRLLPHASLAGKLCLCMAIMAPALAFAAGTPWDSAAEQILNILNGGLARSIAIICLIPCCFLFLTGRAPIGWVVNVVLGIVGIFGAAKIVDMIIAVAN